MNEWVSTTRLPCVPADSQIVTCTSDLLFGRGVRVQIDSPQKIDLFVFEILANPHIRAVVLADELSDSVRNAVWDFWRRLYQSPWINQQHQELVRQFVNLYDGECSIRKTLPPFWPERILYHGKHCTND